MRWLLLILATLFLCAAVFTAKGTHPLTYWQNLAAGVSVMLAAIFSLAAADTPGDNND